MASDAAKAAAYEDTSRRLDDAHAYAQEHGSAKDLGRNVWHAVLDDAIRLRAALSAAEARERKLSTALAAMLDLHGNPFRDDWLTGESYEHAVAITANARAALTEGERDG